MVKRLLQRYAEHGFTAAQKRYARLVSERLRQLNPRAILDVGCGNGDFITEVLGDIKPEQFRGVEGNPADALVARKKHNIEVESFDLNGKFTFPSEAFDVVHSNQVIEHLHNTRGFVEEVWRVLKPGGVALIASENLTSFLNTFAVVLGYTPFSLIRICGWNLGNPLGLHYQNDYTIPCSPDIYAGVNGHVRVLGALQAKQLFERVGFKTSVRTIGLTPFPNWFSVAFENVFWKRGHYLFVEGHKP